MKIKIKQLKTRYDEMFKCICGCSDFIETYKDKSYLYHCCKCGMFCSHKRK